MSRVVVAAVLAVGLLSTARAQDPGTIQAVIQQDFNGPVQVRNRSVTNVLTWSGTAWIASTVSGGGGSSVSTSAPVSGDGSGGNPVTILTSATLQVAGLGVGTMAPAFAGRITATSNIQGGYLISTGGAQLGASAALVWSSQGSLAPNSDGVFSLQNNAGTGFGRLALGPLTSSFPALKTSGTTLAVRLADDSADAPLTASSLTAGSGVFGAVGSTGTLDVYGTTSGHMRITVPSVAGTPTYTFPAAVGGAGTVLGDVAGDGTLSWVGNGGGSLSSTLSSGNTFGSGQTMLPSGSSNTNTIGASGNSFGSVWAKEFVSWDNSSTTSTSLEFRVAGDSQDRLNISAAGAFVWGQGSSTQDVGLMHASAAGQLALTDAASGTGILVPVSNGGGSIGADALQFGVVWSNEFVSWGNSSSTSTCLEFRVAGDSQDRLNISAAGALVLGGGSGSQDAGIDRASSGLVEINNGTPGNASGNLQASTVTATAFKFSTAGTTGVTVNTLGTNGPNATVTPNTWLAVTLSDGSTAYFPVWK